MCCDQLIKIEEEFCGGRVLYHGLVEKTPEEARELLERKKKEEVTHLLLKPFASKPFASFVCGAMSRLRKSCEENSRKKTCSKCLLRR